MVPWHTFCRLLLLLLFLTACGPAVVVMPPIPTSMPQAAVPGAAAPALDPAGVPPTFTPAAGATLEVAQGYQPLAPTGTPTLTPFLPSRTPLPTSTVTPTPSPTGTLAADMTPTYLVPTYPSSGQLGPSKLGIHVIQNNDPRIMGFVRGSTPAVMKGVGDMGFLQEVKAVSPRTITVGRVDDVFIQNYVGSPEEAAREYVRKHLATYRANPWVDYWEGWNEPDPGFGLMPWYTRFESERVRVMAAYGLRSAIGGFPPGVPEMGEFEQFLPAIATAKEHAGILTLHEGDIETGDMRFLYGAEMLGFPRYGDRGLMSFRYRWFYREYLEPQNLVIPLMISELEFAGWDSLDLLDLIDGLAWYDREARQDGYVIGFTVFTAGAIGQWGEFNLNGVLPELAAYVNSQDGR